MGDVLSDGVLGSLYTNQILVFSKSALELHPVESRVALILVSLDEVPSQYEVLGDIIHTRSIRHKLVRRIKSE